MPGRAQREAGWLGLALVVLTAWCGAPAVGDDQANPWLLTYLPPRWQDRVVYYEDFDGPAGSAAINRAGVERVGSPGPEATGLTGRGWRCPNIYDQGQPGQQPLELRGEALGLHRPLTVMMWWRLDAPLQLESGFCLISLAGRGQVSNFVRGRGEWCALPKPTYVSQLYFEGMAAFNNAWGYQGEAWVEPGDWHHVAMTVAGGNTVRIYWDGALREVIRAKGRNWVAGDVTSAQLGSGWLYHPMTVDELVVVDRALSDEELADYVRGCRALRSRGMPPRAGTQPRS